MLQDDVVDERQHPSILVGDAVKIDDEIIILESMKMEIPISSEVNGKIKSIEVSEGDEVDEGQLVAILE